MGELLFCHESIAALPYYIEGMGINIYSMEELSYYIMNYTYLLDTGFMCEELCTWISSEMKAYKLAEHLRDEMRGNRRLSEFVLAILEQSGYCSVKEKQQIVLMLRQMEEKSDFECNKLRTDGLMERGKYLSCIYEYKRLLDSEDCKEQPSELVGNIWHNLGTAYAKLFLFEQALKAYEKAVTLNGAKESKKACLFCYRCLHDEQGFIRKSIEYKLDDMSVQEIRNELSMASRSEELIRFEERMEQMAELSVKGQSQGVRQELLEIVQEWKEAYRKSCRV